MNEGRSDRRGVEGHASQRRNGTGRWNPVQGFLVHGQRQRASVGTLVAPIQAGIKPGRRSLVPSCRLSIPAGGNVLEQGSERQLLSAASVTPGGAGKEGFLAVPPALHFAQPPAHSGAGGPVRNLEAGREEPETLESVLAAVGGANG